MLHSESHVVQYSERNGGPKSKTEGGIEVQLEQVGSTEPTVAGAGDIFVISEIQVFLASIILGVISQKGEHQQRFKNMRSSFFFCFLHNWEYMGEFS